MNKKLLKILRDIENGVIGIVVKGSKPSNEQMKIVRGIRKYFKLITEDIQ